MKLLDKFRILIDEMFEDAKKEFDKIPLNLATEETSIEVKPDGTRITTVKRIWKRVL